jgi:hypothetical protein
MKRITKIVTRSASKDMLAPSSRKSKQTKDTPMEPMCEHVSRLLDYLKNYELTIDAGFECQIHCKRCDRMSYVTMPNMQE